MTQAATRLDVIPQSGYAGAEIRGIDLTRELTDDEITTVRDALLKWKVVFFREQFLDHDQHLRFASYFGNPTPAHPLFDSIPDENYPTIYPIFRDRFKARVAKSNGYDKVRWHADVTAAINPPFASILRAEELPPYGGDTQWSNAVAAYNGLSAPVQRLVDELRAVHQFTPGAGSKPTETISAVSSVARW